MTYCRTIRSANDAKYQINLEFSSGDDPAAGPSIFSALPDQLGFLQLPGIEIDPSNTQVGCCLLQGEAKLTFSLP